MDWTRTWQRRAAVHREESGTDSLNCSPRKNWRRSKRLPARTVPDELRKEPKRNGTFGNGRQEAAQPKANARTAEERQKGSVYNFDPNNGKRSFAPTRR